MHDSPIVSLQDIRFAYPGRPAIFDGLRFDLHTGNTFGLYGPNGSGKTTLLRLLTGLESAQSGQLSFHGRPVSGEQTLHELRCGVGLVMQNADDQLFSPTVLEDVAFGPLNLGLNREEARKRAMEVLQSMDMAGLAQRVTHRLSGGEKKLVAIASILSMRPEAMLLDEPTAFLDDISRDRMIDILRHQDLARVVVSHDRDFLEKTASSFIRIDGGKLTSPAKGLPPLPGCCHTHG